MKLMHTSLPEFTVRMKTAVIDQSPHKKLAIRGLEHLTAAKIQSLRTGRVEKAVEEVAKDREIHSLELIVRPRVPETMHTVIIKGYTDQGHPKKAILESLNIIHPTEDIELEGLDEEAVQDRRPALNEH